MSNGDEMVNPYEKLTIEDVAEGLYGSTEQREVEKDTAHELVSMGAAEQQHFDEFFAEGSEKAPCSLRP